MRNSILPGATPSAAAIETFPATNSTSVTWIVNIASGTPYVDSFVIGAINPPQVHTLV